MAMFAVWVVFICLWWRSVEVRFLTLNVLFVVVIQNCKLVGVAEMLWRDDHWAYIGHHFQIQLILLIAGGTAEISLLRYTARSI